MHNTSTLAVLRRATDHHYLIANAYRNLVVRSVLRWTDCNGFNWTEGRCKSIIQFILHHMQSADDTTPAPDWVGVAKFLSYPLSVLKKSEGHERDLRLLHLVQLWRIYTHPLISKNKKEMTDADLQKFESAVFGLPFYPAMTTDDELGYKNYSLLYETTPDDVMPHCEDNLSFEVDRDWRVDAYARQPYPSGDDDKAMTLRGVRPLTPYAELPAMITLPVLSGGENGWDKAFLYARDFYPRKARRLHQCIRNWIPELIIPQCVEVRNPLVLRKYDEQRVWSKRLGREIVRRRLSQAWKELVYSSRAIHWYDASRRHSSKPLPFSLRQIPVLTCEGLTADHLDGTWRHGSVHSRIQKDGKVRFYQAAPKWAQWMMEPWGRALYKSLKRIPQDCTFNQGAGVTKVQEWLRSGKQVYSIDLSNATDRLPLPLTRTILLKVSRSANQRMWVDTFCILSRLPSEPAYRTDNHQLNGIIRSRFGTSNGVEWAVGQPLGSYPSFAAFALTHHALARAACSRAGFDDLKTMPYVILGDDIVFGDSRAADEYQLALAELDIPVSKDKCLSGKVGEFAGRIITRDSWEYKSKYFHVKHESLLAAIEVFGPRAIRMMPQDRLRDVIALLPTSRSPGGLNPGGFSRQQREQFLVNYFELVDPLSDDDYESGDSFVESERTSRIRLQTRLDWSPISIPSDRWPSRQDQQFDEPLEPTGSVANDSSGAPVRLKPYQIGAASRKMVFKPYKNRAWLRKVLAAAEAAGLNP